MKEFQKDGTTPEQSKLLLELGIPADSANYSRFRDDFYPEVLHSKYSEYMAKLIFTEPEEYTPCWSALRLMEIIDICALGENSDPNTEEYPSTIKVMNKLHIPYVEYLVKSIERAVQLGTIDFSKLEIQ